MKNQANAREKGAGKLAVVSAGAVRRTIAFTSDGETLRGWLYLPERMPAGKKIPGIVTANAMTGVKEINLPEYARRFAEAGFAVVVFDYRGWGASSGEPRCHISPWEQRRDIAHAIDFLAGQAEVDAGRIGGWGISMGGGHMLFLATWEPRFKAVAAVSTGVSPQRAGGLLSVAEAKIRYDQLLAAYQAERARRSVGAATTLQAWCPEPMPGCALPVKEAYDFYETARRSYAPMFENKLTASSFQNIQEDDLTFAIHLAHVPILILHPALDVVPVEDVLFHFKRAPEPKRLVVFSGPHTTTYTGGKHLEEAAEESIRWFSKHLESCGS